MYLTPILPCLYVESERLPIPDLFSIFGTLRNALLILEPFFVPQYHLAPFFGHVRFILQLLFFGLGQVCSSRGASVNAALGSWTKPRL